MNLIILAPAAQELSEAVDFYEERQAGLGVEFLAEFQSAASRIRERPLWFEHFERNFRRCRTKRFPYGIIFQLTAESVVVVAVMHLHRDPNYWQERIDPQDQS